MKVSITLSGQQASNLVMLLKEQKRRIQKELVKDQANNKSHHPVLLKRRDMCYSVLEMLLKEWKGEENE